jgi:uncharacterized caspase-like protein
VIDFVIHPSQQTTTKATMEKVALVIGCSKYSKLHPSTNPTAGNDANDVSQALKQLGFSHIETVIDPDTIKLSFALGKINSKIAEIRLDGTDIVYVLYFAGNCLAKNAQTYLTGSDDDAASVNTPSVEEMLTRFSKSSGFFDVMIALIDSNYCGKLQQVPKNTLLSWSGVPQRDQETGRNSVYTGALKDALLKVNDKIEVVLDTVTKSVNDKTSGKQQATYQSGFGKTSVNLKSS